MAGISSNLPPVQEPLTGCQSNPLVKPLLGYNRLVVSSCDQLTEQCVLVEVIKRIAVIVVIPLAYIALGFIALVGMALNLICTLENRESNQTNSQISDVLAVPSQPTSPNVKASIVGLKDHLRSLLAGVRREKTLLDSVQIDSWQAQHDSYARVIDQIRDSGNEDLAVECETELATLQIAINSLWEVDQNNRADQNQANQGTSPNGEPILSAAGDTSSTVALSVQEPILANVKACIVNHRNFLDSILAAVIREKTPLNSDQIDSWQHTLDVFAREIAKIRNSGDEGLAAECDSELGKLERVIYRLWEEDQNNRHDQLEGQRISGTTDSTVALSVQEPNPVTPIQPSAPVIIRQTYTHVQQECVKKTIVSLTSSLEFIVNAVSSREVVLNDQHFEYWERWYSAYANDIEQKVSDPTLECECRVELSKLRQAIDCLVEQYDRLQGLT